MKPLYLTAGLTAAVLLSACGQKAETNATAANKELPGKDSNLD